MRVEQVMSEAQCCTEGDSIREAARLMKEEDVGFVPICDASRKPIGALTDRDIAVRVVADGRSYDEPCEQFMTRGTVGCRIGDDVKDAEQLMRGHRTSRVMVCDDDGKLKGVVSLQDIADAEGGDAVGRTVQEVKGEQPTAIH